MKALLFSILLTFVSLIVIAQPAIQWQKCLGGSENEAAYAIQQTTDHGYIVAGYTKSNDGDVNNNHGNEDFWVIKLDQNGNLEWETTLGGTAREEANSIQQTSDGGYIAAGFTLSNNGDVSGNHGGEDMWVVKLDSTGALQWQKCLGGSGKDIANYVLETPGGYLIAGPTESNNGDVSGNHGNSDFWIVQLDDVGLILWQQCFGGSENDVATSLALRPGGGYLITGYSYSNNGDVSGNNGLYDFWVVEISNTGTLLSQNSLGGSGFEYSYSISPASNGNILVSGSTGSNDGDVSGNHNSGGFGYSYDQWIVLLNNNGSIIWQKCLGGTDQDIAFASQQTSDGGFVTGGNAWSLNGDVTGNQGNSDFWIVKLDMNGNIEWQKCVGGSNFDMGRDIKQTNDDGYVIAGMTSSTDGDVTGYHALYDVWVVKLEPTIGILPVEISNFSGEVKDFGNILKWSTAREINNDQFEIQRSNDGSTFKAIGSVKGRGDLSEIIHYTFVDENPAIGINYYRLKQIDFNGESSFSEIIALRNENGAIKIFPNPTNETINISGLENYRSEGIYVKIYDLSGRGIKNMIFSESYADIEMNITDLQPGLYFLEITTEKDEVIETLKIIINQ